MKNLLKNIILTFIGLLSACVVIIGMPIFTYNITEYTANTYGELWGLTVFCIMASGIISLIFCVCPYIQERLKNDDEEEDL